MRLTTKWKANDEVNLQSFLQMRVRNGGDKKIKENFYSEYFSDNKFASLRDKNQHKISRQWSLKAHIPPNALIFARQKGQVC